MVFTFKCPNCGNQVVSDDCKFCSKCGAPMERIDNNPNESAKVQTIKASRQKSMIGIIIAAVIGIIVLACCTRFINQYRLEDEVATLLLEDAYDEIRNHYTDYMTLPHALNNGGEFSFGSNGNVSFTANFKVIEFAGSSSDGGYKVTAIGTAMPNFFFTKYKFNYNLLYEDASKPQIEEPVTTPNGTDTNGSSNTHTTSGTRYTSDDVVEWFTVGEIYEICSNNPFNFSDKYAGKVIGVSGDVENLDSTWIGNERYVDLKDHEDNSIFGQFSVACYIYDDDPFISDLSMDGAADIIGVVDKDYVSKSAIHLVDCTIEWAGYRETGFIE